MSRSGWSHPLRLFDRSRSGPVVERVATGFQFTEGPVWISEQACLLFSDLRANRILKLNPDGKVTVFREPSGHSNGLTRDRELRLLVCEHGNRRVTRTEGDGSIGVCADTFQGQRLNSPNDVVTRSDGSVYFTDPPYGIEPHEEEIGIRGVYRVPPGGGEPILLVADFERPNGLAFSPGEERLYVDDSARRHIRSFAVSADGSLSGGRAVCDMNVKERGSPDGMKVDSDGNLYCAGPGGVWILDAEARHLGTIRTPEKPSNCAWGDEDWRSLYITARTSVYKVRLESPGIPVP